MKYTRIYCDAGGVSHFEDVQVEVAPVDFAPPAPPLNLAVPLEAERAVFCEFLRGGSVTGIRRPAASSSFRCRVNWRLRSAMARFESSVQAVSFSWTILRGRAIGHASWAMRGWTQSFCNCG
jgi:hypothetical protein